MNKIQYQKDIQEINDLISKSSHLGIKLIESVARDILIEHSEFYEFVMAMGTAFFTDHNNQTYSISENSKKLKDIKFLFYIISEFDNTLHLTGEPMRFTACGKKITDW
jgi:hypothetical protein